MKKIFSILIVLGIGIALINCSKDEDDPIIPNSSKFYGTWILDYYVSDGQLVEDIMCNEQIRYSFSANETYTKTTFSGDGSSNCVVAVIVNGTWENLGENKYRLIPNGSTTDEVLDIVYKDNFTKFIINYSIDYTEVYVKL